MTKNTSSTKLPRVVIVGRVNVGKSTLFNKLIEQQKALISDIAGTTRDLNFGICHWGKFSFEVVDTGGIFETKVEVKEKTSEDIVKQTELKARQILSSADLILFLVDTKSGITTKDRQIAGFLKKNKTPKFIVSNKADTPALWLESLEFKKLGLGDPIPISATSGKGVGDLLDIIIKTIKKPAGKKIDTKKEDIIRVSIVGKPNVGKSSLLNKIIGEERVIVSPVPHTTREPQDTFLSYKDNSIQLIDTAGIRRKNKVESNSLESSGIQMSIKTLKQSDIALFTIDISQNLASQDAQLAGLITQSGVSVIFIANKYDLVDDKDTSTTKELTSYIYKYFPFLVHAPIIFTSAKSGRNTQKILDLILETKANRQQKIDKNKLNEFVRYLMKKMPPPRQPKKAGSPKKNRAFISKLKQIDANRPIFEIYVVNMANIPESYLRYLENNLRKRFNFSGTPITLRVVKEQ